MCGWHLNFWLLELQQAIIDKSWDIVITASKCVVVAGDRIHTHEDNPGLPLTAAAVRTSGTPLLEDSATLSHRHLAVYMFTVISLIYIFVDGLLFIVYDVSLIHRLQLGMGQTNLWMSLFLSLVHSLKMQTFGTLPVKLQTEPHWPL